MEDGRGFAFRLSQVAMLMVGSVARMPRWCCVVSLADFVEVEHSQKNNGVVIWYLALLARGQARYLGT